MHVHFFNAIALFLTEIIAKCKKLDLSAISQNSRNLYENIFKLFTYYLGYNQSWVQLFSDIVITVAITTNFNF